MDLPLIESQGGHERGSQLKTDPVTVMERELRDLNRQISKAGVQYGLGRVSREGYILYTSRLRARKAQIEGALATRHIEHA